jgi:maltose alpha-D-glucosyltransferase/alpha-amylase
MQWSADRNAGFSRASPSQLYSPVIMDPVYGYEAVNVEAQQHDPSSLLAWMRNMIALRKLFKVFGRGSIEFLHPTNRKVLAYVRRYEEDLILCVANLSRFAQAVELDLSRSAGMVPVEMLGYTEFPRIGELPYLLTMGPYGFYWFELQGAPAPITVPTVTAEDDLELVPLAADGTWSSFFEGRTRTLLETRLLPAFLPKQRWFGGKARTIDRVQIVDDGMLVPEPAPSWLLVIDVTYTDGGTEAYAVPVAVVTGPTAAELERTHPEAVLARAAGRLETGILYDAMSDDTTCHALLAAMEHGRALKTRHGVLRATHTRVFARVRGRSSRPFRVGRPRAEQSNTSVLYGDRLIFKLFRRLQPGPNPDFEIARYLTEQTPFDRIPKLAGAIEYARDGFQGTLGMLQELIPNQGDGWTWMLSELDQYVERVVGLDVQPPTDAAASLVELADTPVPDLVRDTIGLALDAAATLGRRTAELHLMLAAATLDPAFAAEPLTAVDMSVLGNELQAHATRVFDDLRAHLASLHDDVVDKAALALSLRRPLLKRLRTIAGANTQAAKTRIHGDYHLGQVLVVENDFVIIDFEGEPTRSLAERQAKQPPLKDVASMLRSFSYAAHAAVIAATSRRGVDAAKVEPWARVWERWVSATFLKTYRDTAGAAACVPSDPAEFALLLDVFLLDKALYELHYEMNNRPAWLGIPLAGIIMVAEE